MSRTRGKREAGGRNRDGDPFAEEQKKQPGGKRKLLIALGCVAAIAAAIAVVWTLYVRPPDVSSNDRPSVTDNNPNKTQGEEDTDELSGRKEDYFTFLLLGRDTGGGGNTDTIILVSYDVPNQQVNMMSIPRDTAVNVSWSNKKINSVYNAKESSGGGLENLKKQVACLTGVMPDRYVIIEWKAVGELVDAVDGVEFDVPRNMNYDDPYQDLHIHLNKGLQTLNGQQAMGMLRYRNDNGYKAGYNDTGRMTTQRDFLKAMAKEVLQLKNMTKIGSFINIFMDNVDTDLKVNELMWFASQALGVNLDTMQSSTLPYIDVGKYRGEYYFLPNGEEIVPLVNDQFNPYNRPITEKDIQIIARNADGSCYVTNGELLDSRWASPASTSGTAGGGVTTTDPTGVIADPVVPVPSGEPEDPVDDTPQPPEEDPAGSDGQAPAGDPGTENPGNSSGEQPDSPPADEPGDPSVIEPGGEPGSTGGTDETNTGTAEPGAPGGPSDTEPPPDASVDPEAPAEPELPPEPTPPPADPIPPEGGTDSGEPEPPPAVQ